MARDFMGVMRKCYHCKSPDDTVNWSNSMECYVCDDCFTNYNDWREDSKKEDF